jgi:hypothetical protein
VPVSKILDGTCVLKSLDFANLGTAEAVRMVFPRNRLTSGIRGVLTELCDERLCVWRYPASEICQTVWTNREINSEKAMVQP